MTTSTSSPSAIDAVVEALRDSDGDLTSPVKQGHAGIIYSTADDSFTQTTAAPATGTDSQPLYDDGRDLQASANAIGAEYNALVAKLESGRFNPQTGEKVYDVTGRQREVLQLQINQLKVSADYSFGRLNAIAAQRLQSGQQSIEAPVQTMVQMGNGQTMSIQEAAARAAFLDSAPPGQRVAFAADYDKQIQDAKTRAVTNAITNARRR